jgi:hypothetical protein
MSMYLYSNFGTVTIAIVPWANANPSIDSVWAVAELSFAVHHETSQAKSVVIFRGEIWVNWVVTAQQTVFRYIRELR